METMLVTIIIAMAHMLSVATFLVFDEAPAAAVVELEAIDSSIIKRRVLLYFFR